MKRAGYFAAKRVAINLQKCRLCACHIFGIRREGDRRVAGITANHDAPRAFRL